MSSIVHRMSRKGLGLAYETHWATKMAPWIEQWDGAATDVHVPSGPYDPSEYDAYLRWYTGATRWRCFPVADEPVQHEATITDTFASDPPAAFQLVVSSVISM